MIEQHWRSAKGKYIGIGQKSLSTVERSYRLPGQRIKRHHGESDGMKEKNKKRQTEVERLMKERG